MTDLTLLYQRTLEKRSLEHSTLVKSTSKEVEIFNKLSCDLRDVGIFFGVFKRQDDRKIAKRLPVVFRYSKYRRECG